jgi:uncharacterized Zn-finger protein
MAKVMNHRIEKLLTLLDANETQLNVKKINEIFIECENAINETSDDNSCSFTIKVEPLSMPKSKRFKVNTTIRKHKCETCKKRFKSPSQLNIHNRIHSKQKSFSCDQCQMAFSQKGSLSLHKRLHTGEKPYRCDICQKKFAQSHNLTRHKRMHTGEKPFSCDLCLMKFTRSNYLTAHKRSSHKRETVPF